MNAMKAVKLLPLMSWISLTPGTGLLRWLPCLALCWPVRAAADRSTLASETSAAVAADDNAPRGCGWFDSSHDLQQGLRVQEHLSTDSLARELPLGAWLDLQLSGWRAATPAAVSSAFTPVT